MHKSFHNLVNLSGLYCRLLASFICGEKILLLILLLRNISLHDEL